MTLLLPSRSHSLRHLLVDAVGVTVVAAGVAAALLPQGLDVSHTGDTTLPAVHAPAPAPVDARTKALMTRYRCSSEGFGRHQVPRSSVIRRADGRLAVVSFDRGWKAFRSHGAESLVAVCLAPPR